MNYKKSREIHTHTIRTNLGFNLMGSGSKLKRGVIGWTGGLFWFFVIVDFSSPILFVSCYVSIVSDKETVLESFSVKFIC